MYLFQEEDIKIQVPNKQAEKIELPILSAEPLLNPNVPEFVPTFASATPKVTEEGSREVLDKPEEPEKWVEVCSKLLKIYIVHPG